MDAFGVLNEVLGDYENFVKGFLEIKDDQIRGKVEKEIADGLLWPEPWLGLNPAFESGGTVSELVERDVLAPEATQIFRDPTGKEITFHRHQTDAFEIANRRESYVLTTGTGSGKSMAYIVPIVDRVLREGSGKGVRAIIVYPMNALANSQRNELEKFLGKTNPKVSFARYTGQENRDEREKTLASPPDILLTNYVMLELMLTRPKERNNLISSAANLSFLVLDELHTYRGRQGADVAMLVRRLRGAVTSNDVQCVGTSATLAGPGTKAEQRQQVAELATRIFGVAIPAANIVGETLRRATTGEADPATLAARLAASTPAEWDELKADPLAVWIEQHFGLHTDDEGKLARRPPSKLSDAATKLHDETGVDEAVCREKLQELLLAGSRARDPHGRSLFAFKLHQFIGKGDTVYTTLEPPAKRFLTTQYQRSAPNRPAGQPLFPLAFCRECGQDFLVVNLERGGESFSPRIPNSDLVEHPDADGLLLLTEQPWPDPQDPALLDLVPEDWVVSSGSGQVLDKARITKLPNSLRVDEFGTITDDGMPVAFFERLEFCPSCKTSYESTRQSQFSRVASLGTEGRASAVTVLSQSIVRALRSEPDLDDDARKFLAFSDNRQDASLQAGHFNDFVLVGLIRSALYRAAADYQEHNPGKPLTDENLGPEVVKALSGTSLKFFARDEETADEHIPRKKIARALRDVVAYRLWADLKRGWRITMPNLEQTGQLRLAYEGVDELAANDDKWASYGHLEFPGIFTVPDDGSADAETGWTGGFSCVAGNPPWERVKIQDKEFFSQAGRPDIESAATAAIRKKMIDKLADSDPDLHDAYLAALRQSDGTAHLLLKSGRYPFTGKGDVNTYSVFAETMRTVTNPEGAAGIITPTGLATDKTTAPFFADTLSNHRLYAFYDFENEAKIFRDVHHAYRFAVTTMTGTHRTVRRTKFAFLNRHISDVSEKRFQLAAKEVLALNPNTGTLPMFRSRTDADITLGIYSRHPVLIRDGDPDGNPWGLSFARLFDMANDSGLFHTADDLADAKFNGWSYKRGNKEYVPLYEAKMLSHFDHRFSTYKGATQAQLNVGALPRLTDEQHDDPDLEPLARYWVDRPKVAEYLRRDWDRDWLFGWRDIARSSDSRTMGPSILPYSAVAGGFPLALTDDPTDIPLLQAVWTTYAFDYVVRQKNAGSHLNMTLMRQIACPTPDVFERPTPWRQSMKLAQWVRPYLLELAYTSWRVKPYAEDLGDENPPFRWNPERRALLRADLDAGFLQIYGLDRDEAEHVLDSFPVVRKYEERDFGEYRTKRLVLEAYDRMAEAIANGGKGWKPLADPPAGHGPRHSE